MHYYFRGNSSKSTIDLHHLYNDPCLNTILRILQMSWGIKLPPSIGGVKIVRVGEQATLGKLKNKVIDLQKMPATILGPRLLDTFSKTWVKKRPNCSGVFPDVFWMKFWFWPCWLTISNLMSASCPGSLPWGAKRCASPWRRYVMGSTCCPFTMPPIVPDISHDSQWSNSRIHRLTVSDEESKRMPNRNQQKSS